MLSKALNLLVSSVSRFTTIIRPSSLSVLPPVKGITMSLSDRSFRKVTAVGSKEAASTVSLNDRVSVSSVKFSLNAKSSGICLSSINCTAGLALLVGTGNTLLPAMSSANSSVIDIQQLLISEQRALSF